MCHRRVDCKSSLLLSWLRLVNSSSESDSGSVSLTSVPEVLLSSVWKLSAEEPIDSSGRSPSFATMDNFKAVISPMSKSILKFFSKQY